MTWVKKIWLMFLMATLFVSWVCPFSRGEESVVLGAVEKVRVLPWGFTLMARVDTGAAKSSMAALNLKVRGKTAEFRLPDPSFQEKLKLPILGWVEVRTNLGKEKRPLVLMEICVAGKRFQTPVNLDDRSGLKYPMLLGRDTLKGRFLVDVSKANLHSRLCPNEGEEEHFSKAPKAQNQEAAPSSQKVLNPSTSVENLGIP